jgi:hypothetical protein
MPRAKTKKSKVAFKQNDRAVQLEVSTERVSAKAKTNQQTWAENAYQLIRQEVIPSAPADVIVTYGFPRGTRGKKHLGQCWHKPVPDQAAVIFVHPCQWTTPLEVLDTLTHEAVHAATPGSGHKDEFKRLALSIGMRGPMTSATAGPELALRLDELAKKLGEFPAAAFDPPTKKQSTRLRKWQCRCPIKVRVAWDVLHVLCLDCNSEFEKVEKDRERLNAPATETAAMMRGQK